MLLNSSYFGIWRGHNCIDNTRLQIQKNRPWYIVIIISLIEKYILSIQATIRCEIFESSIW